MENLEVSKTEDNNSKNKVDEEGLGPFASLKKSFEVIKNNPIIIPIAFVLIVISQSLNYFITNTTLYIIITLLLWPISFFVLGGVYNIVIHAQDGKVGNWSSVFLDGGKKNWLRLTLSMVLFFILLMVLTLVTYLLFFISLLFTGGAFALASKIHVILGIIVMALLLFIIGPLFSGIMGCLYLFVQFFDIGIVALDFGVVDSFKESVRFVRSRFNSVFKYTLIKFFGLFLIYAPMFPYFIKSIKQPLTNPQVQGRMVQASLYETYGISWVLTALFLTLIATVLFWSYHPTYYVQNVVFERVRESNFRILLKIYAIGTLFLILFAGIVGAIYVSLGPNFQAVAMSQALKAQNQGVVGQPVTKVSCFDSDGGLNYFVKGTTNNRFGQFEDRCSGNIPGGTSKTSKVGLAYVQERYCVGDNVESEFHLCEIGCVDGRCVTSN